MWFFFKKRPIFSLLIQPANFCNHAVISLFPLDDLSQCNSFLLNWSQRPENKHLIADDDDEVEQTEETEVNEERVSSL